MNTDPVKWVGMFTFVLLSGCGAKADVLRLDEVQRAPSDPASIEVLLEEPSRAYLGIALIDVSDQGWDLPLEELRDKLVAEAANLGGDAVILGLPEAEGGGAVIVPIGNMFYASSFDEKRLVGKVIVWK